MNKSNSVELRKLRESEQRRKDIIKAVRALIKAGGAREITLRKVAEKAGFSTTVVYNLFQNKATLITQAMDSDLLDLVKAMRNAVDAKLPLLENIRRVGRAYVTFGMRHPDQYALVFMERRPHAPVESSRVRQWKARASNMATRRKIPMPLPASFLSILPTPAKSRRTRRRQPPRFSGKACTAWCRCAWYSGRTSLGSSMTNSIGTWMR
jgi:AcrR family transcriptional regulator